MNVGDRVKALNPIDEWRNGEMGRIAHEGELGTVVEVFMAPPHLGCCQVVFDNGDGSTCGLEELEVMQ